MTEKALPQFIHHESSPLGNILLLPRMRSA